MPGTRLICRVDKSYVAGRIPLVLENQDFLALVSKIEFTLEQVWMVRSVK